MGAVELLETVFEHRTVVFFEDAFADIYLVVRADSKDVSVIGGVMNLAQGQTILNHRRTTIICVRNDVSRVQKFRMGQAANGAALAVCGDHDVSERALMEALAGLARNCSKAAATWWCRC